MWAGIVFNLLILLNIRLYSDKDTKEKLNRIKMKINLLGIKNIYLMETYNRYSMGASSSTRTRQIFLDPKLIKTSTDEQLWSIICHELGHIIEGHSVTDIQSENHMHEFVADGYVKKFGANPKAFIASLLKMRDVTHIYYHVDTNTHPSCASRAARLGLVDLAIKLELIGKRKEKQDSLLRKK